MGSYFRAVAIDYDGTLTQAGRPSDDVLTAIRELRSRGGRCVLVTGRILAELYGVFPDYGDHFDLVVAENGGVVAAGRLTMRLSAPVSTDLDPALHRLGVAFRRGEVIVATYERHESSILQEVHRRGLDSYLVRNRGELMLVPAGVSKATGLRYALLQLGVSPRSSIAIGDAENDLAMLDACEIAVAVENSVESVKAHADLVLTEPNGAGVASFLRSSVFVKNLRIQTRRRQVTLGRSPSGDLVQFPASRVNVLITGGVGSGKSFAAGLVAEQLIQLGYVICVFDPEGDHALLGRLPNVVTLGGRDRTPSVEDVAQILEQSGTSVVIDLSLVSPVHRSAWTAHALHYLEARRNETGVPHWLVIDEAHAALGGSHGSPGVDGPLRGYCLVTYLPTQLAGGVKDQIDYLLHVAGKAGLDEASVRAVAAATGLPFDTFSPFLDCVQVGEALLVPLASPSEVQCVSFAPRWIAHVRHWHKYATARLPTERSFHFRGPTGLTGAVAGNMEEFHQNLQRASLDAIRQHAKGGDFSRWTAEVFRDSTLASALRLIERRLCSAASKSEAEAARRELMAAIEKRYVLPVGAP